jgi:predicted SAM-dependent methyltransferase
MLQRLTDTLKVNLPEPAIAALLAARDTVARPYRVLKLRQRGRKLQRSGEVLMLEIGSGGKKGTNGWTTVDVCRGCDIRWDLRRPLPLPENSVSKIYSSHFLEHLAYGDLLTLLQNLYYVMIAGGVFSASVPNARIFLDAYSHPDNFDASKYCAFAPAYHFNGKIDYVNYISYMDGQHRYMFDEENLITILGKSGFKNARVRDFDPLLDMESRRHESLYVEANK